MPRAFRNYGLSITLAALWLSFWTLQTISGWTEFVAEQAQHGAEAQLFAPDGYIWNWARATFENLQSEMFQLFMFVVLTAMLVHRGSPESKDGDERLERKIDEIRQQVKALAEKRAA